MKRGTAEHPKTLDLAAALNLPQWGAVGILESLWHFAAKFARRGDIGRRTDAAIARGIDWRDDPEKLIQALVDTGWLDRCRCHRLRIHDWHEHADQTVRRTEEIKARGFLECYGAPEPLRGAAFGGPAVNDEPSDTSDVPQTSQPVGVEQSASSQLAADERATSQPWPLPTPEPTPTEPPPPPTALPRRGGGAPRARSRNRRLTGERDQALEYWTQIGGRPTRQDRRKVWEALARGQPLPQVLGSIAERVRDELLAAGRLGPTDPWPPPGLAPFDPPPAPEPRPEPDAAEAEEGRRAWERVSAALEGRVRPQAWATWLRPCRGLWLREGRLQLEVPGAQHLAWIGQAWSVDLAWAAAEAGLEGVDLVMPPARAVGE